MLAGADFPCGLAGVEAGTGASLGAVNPGDTFDGGAVGADAVNAGGAKEIWWFAVGAPGRCLDVEIEGVPTGAAALVLRSLAKSRADLPERSFISGPVVLAALSLEMNCASETFRFTTGAEVCVMTFVTDRLVLTTAAAGGAQSRLRGLCQSRFMFQFW
jgi:hypothetical protein